MNKNQADNANNLYVVMLMYNLIEYNDNYVKESVNLWQYHKNGPNVNIICYNYEKDSSEQKNIDTLTI